MDTLTNEDNLLSVSRSTEPKPNGSSSETPTGEKLIRGTSDNFDTIQEVKVNYQADNSALATQAGAHGSYRFFMHVLTLPPICALKRNPRIRLTLTMAIKLELRTEARFRRIGRLTSYNGGSILRIL